MTYTIDKRHNHFSFYQENCGSLYVAGEMCRSADEVIDDIIALGKKLEQLKNVVNTFNGVSEIHL